MTPDEAEQQAARDEVKKALQMADLGSDRREFLSTHDLPKNISRVSMEEIEANRAFHKEKSAAGRQYLAHQTQLDAWSTLASNIGDTEQLEKLQPLMHGQSHRVRLAETVQASGGQQYGEGYGKNAQSKPENNHPHPQSPRGRGGPAGRGMPSGRGGPFGRGAGIEAINRGRGRGPGFRGGIVRSQSMALTASSGPTRQDPALDSNNGGPLVLGKRDRGGIRRGPRVRASNPPTRARKVAPMESFVNKLASPLDFLAAARSSAQTKSQPPASSHPAPPSPVPPPPTFTPPVTPPVPPPPASTPPVSAPRVSARPVPAPQASTRPVPAPRTAARSVSVPVPTPVPAPRVSVPQAIIEEAQISRHTNENSSPRQPAEVSLLDFSSEDEESDARPKAQTQGLSTGILLDLDPFNDLGPLPSTSGRLSEVTQMQLSGLEFESPVQILDDPSESSLIDHEIIPQNLQQATVQVTGMIGRLDECLSPLEGKLSDSPNEPEACCEIPPRPVTPQRSLETNIRTPDSEQELSKSFIEHRSPANSCSSGNSSEQTKKNYEEENLSPRKMTTTSSVPIQGFGKLRISQPPGLEFGQDEPQTTAAMRSREAYVRPEPNTRAIGIQPQSINAKGPEKAWKLGGATTIGVRPSYEKTITSNVTVNYASPVNYQSPDCIRSRATSTASNLPIQSSAFQPAQLDSSLRSIPKEPVGLESSRHATKANSSAPPIRNQPGLRQSSYASDSPAGFQSRKASFSDTTRHTTQQATGPPNTMKPSTPRRSSDRHIPEPSLKPESQSLTKVTQAQSHIPEAKPRLSGLAASRFSTEQTASPQLTMGPSTTPKPSSRYTPNPPFKPEPPLAPKVVWTQAQGSEVKPKSSGLSASRFSTEQANSPQPTMIPSTSQKPSSRYTPDPPLPPEPRVVPKVGRTQALASEAKPKSSGLSASRFATNPSSESTMDPTVSSTKKGSKAIRAGLRFFEGV